MGHILGHKKSGKPTGGYIRHISCLSLPPTLGEMVKIRLVEMMFLTSLFFF